MCDLYLYLIIGSLVNCGDHRADTCNDCTEVETGNELGHKCSAVDVGRGGDCVWDGHNKHCTNKGKIGKVLKSDKTFSL